MGSVAEGGSLVTVGGLLANIQKNVEKLTCIRMWISIQNPKSPENSPKNFRKTQKATNY